MHTCIFPLKGFADGKPIVEPCPTCGAVAPPWPEEPKRSSGDDVASNVVAAFALAHAQK